MIRELLKEGFLLKNKGYYKHAIEAFYKALEYDNNSLELLLEIAESYYLMGSEEKSLRYIEQILEKKPTHIESLRFLKNIFINKKAWSEAEQTSKNIYVLTKYTKDLADIFFLLNKQEKYNEIFDYKNEKINDDVLYEKTYAKYCLGKFSEAEEYINQISENSLNNKTLLLKGKIYFKLDRIEDCENIIAKFNTEDNNPELFNFIGLVNQVLCKYKIALDNFINATKLDTKNDEYLYNCASTYFKMGDITLAKKYYNLAISLNPTNQNYHFALANLYYSEKHYKRALEELDFDFFEAKLLRAIILHDSGYIALAHKEFKKLIIEKPENFIIKEYLNKIQELIKI